MQESDAVSNSSLNKICPACAITVKSGASCGMIVTAEPSGLRIGIETPEKIVNDYAVLFHGTSGQEMAIQIFALGPFEDSRIRDRFVHQVKILMQLSHPDILKILSFIEQDGLIYLVLQHFNGEPLDTILKRGALPVQKSVAIFGIVLEVFDYMHSNGVLHGDLNPADIIISPEETVKLIYIGTADVLDKEVKITDDIRNLGAILFEMLTGRAADEFSRNRSEICRSMKNKQLVDVISKSLSENPADRYRTVKEFSEAIRASADDDKKTASEKAGIVKMASRIPKTNRWIAAIALTAIALAIPAASLLLNKEQKPLPALIDSKKIETAGTAQKPAGEVTIATSKLELKDLKHEPAKKARTRKRTIDRKKPQTAIKKQAPPAQKTADAKTPSSPSASEEKSGWTIQK